MTIQSPQFSRLPRFIVKLLFAGVVLTTGFIFLVALNSGAPEMATAMMVLGLIVLWVVLGGTLMYHFREQVRKCMKRLPFDWRVQFVLFATILALIEEAIAVLMTNLAPLLGVKVGEAYITASTNFLDLVLFHSVVVFVPLFIAWAVLLSRYDFSPFTVFLLFGLTGVICEATINPAGALVGFAMWIFIYGLMVYLPAYCIPPGRAARTAKWNHHLLAIPATFLLALPLLIPIKYVLEYVLQHPR